MTPSPPDVPFPFDANFQMKLLKMISMDGGLVDEAMKHVQPHYFSTPELRWIAQQFVAYYQRYSGVPSIAVLQQLVNTVPKLKPTVDPLLYAMHTSHLQEGDFIKDKFLDWIRQCIFHRSFKEATSLWNNNKRDDAISLMQSRMEEMQRVHWETMDDGWLMEGAGARELARAEGFEDQLNFPISTSLPGVDQVLDGGLSPGELGIWIAYAKGGKSTLLMNHGAESARQYRPVLHFVLEGSRALVENRYDSYFSQWKYSDVKKGKMGGQAYKAMMQEYQTLHRQVLVCALLEKWDYSILDIDARLKHYRRMYGWKPEMIIIDYGDLLHGRSPPYQAPWMSERDCFRDMKLLSNRGYAVWTASQAQRPQGKNYDVDEHIIKVAQIAGGIEKVRVADFVGSINMTADEKQNGVARLWQEIYRDNEAGKLTYTKCDLSRMTLTGEIPIPSAHMAQGASTHSMNGLGYST